MENTARNRNERFCALLGYTGITTNGEMLFAKKADGSEDSLGFDYMFDDYYAVMMLEKRKQEIDELIEMFKELKDKKKKK